MGVFGVFFGCRGAIGFSGRSSGVSSGDGGFMLACISGCRGVIGFNVATSQLPVREKVRPARSDGRREREKVRPAYEKWPEIDGLWRAGRVFSRKRRWKSRAGRSFSRLSTRGPALGELFRGSNGREGALGELCRDAGASAPRGPDGPAVLSAPASLSPGGRRGPGAWRESRRAPSRRSGSPAPPTQRPSRSSGTSERSRGR